MARERRKNTRPLIRQARLSFFILFVFVYAVYLRTSLAVSSGVWSKTSSVLDDRDDSPKANSLCSSRRRTTQGDDGCGAHGSCLIDFCICDADYEGPFCTQQLPPETRDVRCLFHPEDSDVCQNTRQGYGRVKVVSTKRARQAQACETSFWETTTVPVRNQQQVMAFQKFESLPRNLGHVVEVGAGPYTKTRLILETGKQQRTVQSVTLVDPLIREYRKNANITTSYPNGLLCLEKTACIQDTILKSAPGEEPLPIDYYDTAILVNTLEHCQNAIQVLDNVYQSLKPGGILVFGESFATDWELRASDPCHPIQITRKLFDKYLAAFSGKVLMTARIGEEVQGVTDLGAKRIYAILSKTS
jgi:SAM-dependent methyltransferase